jgi:pyruvate/oxaloacetate carboxyltransferase
VQETTPGEPGYPTHHFVGQTISQINLFNLSPITNIMAEALAALAIACNVIQVISFCHETVDLAIKIHKQGTADVGLLQSTKRIEALSQQLDLSIQSTQIGTGLSPAQKELSDIAKDCSSTAKQLSVELDKISKSRGGTVFKTARTLLKKSKLEKLESTMQQHRQVLDSRLLVQLL